MIEETYVEEKMLTATPAHSDNDGLAAAAPEWLANEYEAGNDGQFQAAYGAMQSIGIWGHGDKGIALDIGCGTGRLVEALARNGWKVDCLDVSHSMIHAVIRRCQSLPVSANVCDVNHLSLTSQKYALVSCCWMLHWLIRAQRALEQMANALAPSGYLVLQWSCGQPRAQGFALRDTLQEVFDRPAWRERLKEAPLAMYQHPIEEVIDCLENAGLDIVSTRENIKVSGGEDENSFKRALRSAAFASQTAVLGDDVDSLIEESLGLLVERDALYVANTEIIARMNS